MLAIPVQPGTKIRVGGIGDAARVDVAEWQEAVGISAADFQNILVGLRKVHLRADQWEKTPFDANSS